MVGDAAPGIKVVAPADAHVILGTIIHEQTIRLQTTIGISLRYLFLECDKTYKRKDISNYDSMKRVSFQCVKMANKIDLFDLIVIKACLCYNSYLSMKQVVALFRELLLFKCHG